MITQLRQLEGYGLSTSRDETNWTPDSQGIIWTMVDFSRDESGLSIEVYRITP